MRHRKSQILDFATYEFDEKQSLPERAAHALHWAMINYPRQVVPYNILLRAIMGYAHTPRINNDEVERLRGKMSSIKNTLRNSYDTGFYSVRGLGVRATVDSEDQLKTAVVHASKRVTSAYKSLQNAASLVDIKQVPNTPDNRGIIKWYNSGLKQQLSAIPNYIAMLKPPSDEPDPEGGDER